MSVEVMIFACLITMWKENKSGSGSWGNFFQEYSRQIDRKQRKTSKKCDDILSSEADSDDETSDDLRNRYELEARERENKEHLMKNEQNRKVGILVVVEFSTKSTKKHFVG